MSTGTSAPGRTRDRSQLLLPAKLLSLPLAQLQLAEGCEQLTEAGLLTIGDLLATQLSPAAEQSVGEHLAELANAIARVLEDGLRQFGDAGSTDVPTLLALLLGPLDDGERSLLRATIGIDSAALKRTSLLHRFGLTSDQLDQAHERLRSVIQQRAATLYSRLRREVELELRAGDGVVFAQHAAPGTVLRTFADDGEDRELGVRLAAFCLPSLCHAHRGVLHGLPPRQFRDLLRQLPALLPQHRLPRPIADVAAELRGQGLAVPCGVLLHTLRTELRIAIELNADAGEVAVPDPRAPSARLVEILLELGHPAALSDLLFAYRERFRFASRRRLLRHLTGSSSFLCVGPDVWSLRRWHTDRMRSLREVVDRVARRIAHADGRCEVSSLLASERLDEVDTWLAIDALRADPRVRWLGRGEACSAERRQSRVMDRLLRALRRAAGDVVLSRFVQNQPTTQRRLVDRLLRHNRAFVTASVDRIDTLANYPFNHERMQRLLRLVQDQLQQRTGYAHAAALKDAVDETDLGGSWLTADLLADILRRNGPFDVLANGIVAPRNRGLPGQLQQKARQALRALGTPATIADIVRTRPELSEFAPCLADLLAADPLVHSPGNGYFALA